MMMNEMIFVVLLGLQEDRNAPLKHGGSNSGQQDDIVRQRAMGHRLQDSDYFLPSNRSYALFHFSGILE